jgi:sulfite dehydrogenase
MKRQLIRIMLSAGALAAGPALAVEIKLPPENATFKPSQLPGYALAQRNCITCHSVHYIQTQPLTLPRSYWDATVKKMKKPFGAQFPDEDIPAMVDYLVKTYGAERSSAALTPAATVSAAVIVSTGSAPMQPVAQLGKAEAAALARYVLSP